MSNKKELEIIVLKEEIQWYAEKANRYQNALRFYSKFYPGVDLLPMIKDRGETARKALNDLTTK